MRLQPEDADALDLLLDGGQSSTAGSVASDSAHLEHVQRCLDLLALQPVEDPPADLAGRTLARVFRFEAAVVEAKRDLEAPWDRLGPMMRINTTGHGHFYLRCPCHRDVLMP